MRMRVLSSLLLLGAVAAQAQEPPGVATPPKVVVTRSLAVHSAILAKSKAMSRGLSMTCNPAPMNYGSRDDNLMLYLRDTGMLDGADGRPPPLPTSRRDAEAFQRSVDLLLDVRRMMASLPREQYVPGALWPERENTNLATDDPGRADPLSCGKGDVTLSHGQAQQIKKDVTLIEGFVALERQDYGTARQQFLQAWNRIGYEEAALMLGKMAMRGMGGPRDPAQAANWFKLVLAQRYHPVEDRLRSDPDNPGRLNVRCEAAMTLAKLALEAGDRTAALAWYGKAFELGYLPAANRLAQVQLAGSVP